MAKIATVRTPGISAAQMQEQRGSKRYVMWAVTGVAALVGFIPMIGGAISGTISHVSDRINNRVQANDELKLRTQYFADQIGAVVGKDPRSVTVGDFKKAAARNATLHKAYNKPLEKEAKENNTSALVNTGAAVAGAFIPGGGTAVTGTTVLMHGLRHASKLGSVAFAAKSIAGGMAGGALGNALAKDTLDSQEMIESLEKTLVEADQRGIARREIVSPQLIFMTRVAQDEVLASRIEKQFGKKLQQMNEQEFNAVLNTQPLLAQAAMNEAHAISNRQMHVRDLGATAPNLSVGFTAALGARAPRLTSFTAQVDQRRQAPQHAAGVTA